MRPLSRRIRALASGTVHLSFIGLAMHVVESPPAEIELVARIQRGDRSAEEEFARRYTTRLQLMALARTRDPSAAEDLSQDAVLACLQALRHGQIEFPEHLAAFVHGTMRNILNNYFRSQGRRPDEVPLGEEFPAPSAPGNLERDERLALVRKTIARLGETDRAILRMSLIDGVGPSEIARLLRLGPDVVRARKSRATKRVIRLLRGTSRTAAGRPLPGWRRSWTVDV